MSEDLILPVEAISAAMPGRRVGRRKLIYRGFRRITKTRRSPARNPATAVDTFDHAPPPDDLELTVAIYEDLALRAHHEFRG